MGNVLIRKKITFRHAPAMTENITLSVPVLVEERRVATYQTRMVTNLAWSSFFIYILRNLISA